MSATVFYEVSVTINGEQIVVGYTYQQTKKALFVAAFSNDFIVQRIFDALPGKHFISTYSYKKGWSLGDSVRIHVTGKVT
jgi:hypothetical protein